MFGNLNLPLSKPNSIALALQSKDKAQPEPSFRSFVPVQAVQGQVACDKDALQWHLNDVLEPVATPKPEKLPDLHERVDDGDDEM